MEFPEEDVPCPFNISGNVDTRIGTTVLVEESGIVRFSSRTFKVLPALSMQGYDDVNDLVRSD